MDLDIVILSQEGSLEDVKKAVRSQNVETTGTAYIDYKALQGALKNGKIGTAKFLLSDNFRCNKIPSDLEPTPLHLAVDLKDQELITMLLQRKASITAVTHEKNTPIHTAFIAGQTEIVNVLLQHVVEKSEYKNCKNQWGLSHLHIACTTENSTVIKKYLEAANVNLDDAVSIDLPKWAGYKALDFAVKFKSSPAMKALIESGKRMEEHGSLNLLCAQFVTYSNILNVKSGQNGCIVDTSTNFHNACMGNDPYLVETFLKEGASANFPIVSEQRKLCPLYSPLHFAVEGGCLEIVEVLLKHGADLTKTNGYKMTALHLAMYNDNGDVIGLLYSKVENKEANLKDDNQLSYFHIAIVENDLQLVKKMLDESQNDIVNSQVLANNRGFSLFTPLHFALQYGHDEMVKLLVQHGADLNAVSSKGTPLHIAASARCPKMINLLLALGARADIIVNKETVIHALVRAVMENWHTNNDENQRMLIYVDEFVKLGCDINARNEDGNTALHLVCNNNLWIEKLLENSADSSLENNKNMIPLDLACHNYRMTKDLDDPKTGMLYCHFLNLGALSGTGNQQMKEYSKCKLYFARNNNENSEEEEEDENMWNRLGEIEKMKEEKLNRKTSLYDFVRLEDEREGAYATYGFLKSIVEDKYLKQWYQVYGYLIKATYRRSQKYAENKQTRKRNARNENYEDGPFSKRANVTSMFSMNF